MVNKMLELIGFPMKYGCNINGSDLGIDVLKKHIIFDYLINVKKYKTDYNSVLQNDIKLAKVVNKIIKDKNIPITIGGDHSLSIGTIAGSSQNYDDLGIIWFDTHPDLNTNKTTLTNNIHGYPLASSIGYGQKKLVYLYNKKIKVNYNNVILFAINDIDKKEQELIDKLNIKTFTLDYIKNNGIEKSINEAISYLKNKNIHLSIDIDSINYSECPGVNVANKYKNGLSKKEAILAINNFIKKLKIVSVDIVEYNPLNDINNKSLNIILDIYCIFKKSM